MPGIPQISSNCFLGNVVKKQEEKLHSFEFERKKDQQHQGKTLITVQHCHSPRGHLHIFFGRVVWVYRILVP